MAPTSDERREVAARLRERAQLSNFCPFESFFVRLNVIIFGDNGWDRTDGGVFERLADLIDPKERTCHPKGDWKHVSQTQKVRRLVCDCGYEFGVDRENAAPFDISIMCELPNFCPNCGARVTSGGER